MDWKKELEVQGMYAHEVESIDHSLYSVESYKGADLNFFQKCRGQRFSGRGQPVGEETTNMMISGCLPSGNAFSVLGFSIWTLPRDRAQAQKILDTAIFEFIIGSKIYTSIKPASLAMWYPPARRKPASVMGVVPTHYMPFALDKIPHLFPNQNFVVMIRWPGVLSVMKNWGIPLQVNLIGVWHRIAQ